eukprot:3816454-Karenia_brevis.AAC.1
MKAVSSLVHAWKSRSKPVKHQVISGDFNVTLPSSCHPITGKHVHKRQNYCKKRVDAIMDWLASLELKALNTWIPGPTDSQQTWTWKNSRGFRSQIDYICAPRAWTAQSAVQEAWSVKSDHWPVLANITVPASFGR